MDNLNKEYKILIISEKINIYNDQIVFLENAILENPNGDHPEKPSRQSILDDYRLKATALQSELDLLTNHS